MVLLPKPALTSCVLSLMLTGGLSASHFAKHKNFNVHVGSRLPFLLVLAPAVDL